MFKAFSDKVKSRIDNSTAIASIPQVSSNKLISIGAGIGYSGEKFASIALGIPGQNKSKDFIYKLNAALSTNLNWNIGVGFNYSFIPIHDKKEGNNIEIEGLLKENNELKEKLKDNDKKIEELNKKINLLIKNGDKQIINNYTLNEIYKTYNLFGYEIDKYILTEEQNKSLDNILLDISKESEIIIVGYSDTRGTDKYNLQLSYKRAKAVSEYLLNKGFLNIIVKSNGYNMLIEESKGEQFKNRRVELIVKEK